MFPRILFSLPIYLEMSVHYILSQINIKSILVTPEYNLFFPFRPAQDLHVQLSVFGSGVKTSPTNGMAKEWRGNVD